jgi:hypothetical protein
VPEQSGMWRWRVLCASESFGIIDFFATSFRTRFLLCNWHHLFTSPTQSALVLTRERLICPAHINTGWQIRWCFMKDVHWGSTLLLYAQFVASIAVLSTTAGAETSSWTSDLRVINGHIRYADGRRTRFRSGESTIIMTLVEYTSNPPHILRNPKVQRRKYKSLEPIPSTSRPQHIPWKRKQK